eukprot:gene15396-6635_t
MDSPEAVLQDLHMLQRMIDMRITSLEGLRREESSASSLIQHEIRTVEGKLMKLFSKQLSTIYKNHDALSSSKEDVSKYSKLDQFLQVVDVECDVKEKILESCDSLPDLCALPDERIRRFFKDRLRNGEKANDLVWESWGTTASESDGLGRESDIYGGGYDDEVIHKNKALSLPSSMRYGSLSIPPSPVLFATNDVSITRSKSDEANIDYVVLHDSAVRDENKTYGNKVTACPKISYRVSCQSHIRFVPGQRVHLDSCSSSGSGHTIGSTGKGPGSKPRPLNLTVTNTNGFESSSRDYDCPSSSHSVSQSPRTPTRLLPRYGMGHSIKHLFSAKTFLISLTCEYCHRLMFVGVKCKECGFKCHKKCSRKAPPSCGLPPALEKIFIDALRDSGGDAFKFHTLPNMKRTVSDPSSILLQVDKDTPRRLTPNRSHGDLATHAVDQRNRIYSDKYYTTSNMSHSGDSCSTTSSASSDPSSPAVTDSPSDTANMHNVPYYMTPSATNENFFFPGDDTPEIDLINSTTETETSTLTGTMRSNMSMDTMVQTEGSSYSKSSSGTKSTESTISETDDFAIDNLDSQISDIIPHRIRPRGDEPLTKEEKLDMLMNMHERGSLMSEWVIPFSDIELEELIGRGRMGEVYKARWHGEVAVKILYVENPSEKEKSAFKYKVQTFRKTRHENLILFMGACMEPPTLAIVTSLCKGLTLHQHIHEQNNTFDNNRIITIITQVAQGMGYLHARGIVHKDLNSKNIFVEKHRIVITDFGLLNVADTRSPLERPGWLLIMSNWLCYQAPEIVRALDPLHPGTELDLYTKETDVYAFGTVWYELLSKRWPFDDQPVDATIWQIGKGFKQSLSKLEVSRDAKDILSMCWAYNSENRPQFFMLTKAFERLPKKKLIRSPSQPMYPMSRSADALVLF